MYWLIATLTGLALDVFFRRAHVEGSVPSSGPVLIVANHFNALLDPVTIAKVAKRKVRFLAKEPLFRQAVIKYLVKGMGALPVYRRMDGADTAKNAEMFAAVHQALGDGEAVALFPEGISHNEPSVQPLKTGAARMALGAEEAHDFSLGLKIVPLGMVFRDKRTFRSDVATFVGEAIEVGAFQAQYADDDRAAAHALTEKIDEGLRAVTVNMERWDDRPLLELAERIWREDEDNRVHRIKRMADAMRELRQIEPVRMQALRDRIAELRHRMEQLGMRPGHLDVWYTPGAVLGFLVRNLFALLIGLPTALIGVLSFALPFSLAKAVPNKMDIDVDEISSFGLLAGIILMPLWTTLLAIASFFAVRALAPAQPWTTAAAVAGALALALPLSGWYAHHFFRRRRAAMRDIKVFFTFGRSGPLRASLKAELDEVQEEIAELERILWDHREAQGRGPRPEGVRT